MTPRTYAVVGGVVCILGLGAAGAQAQVPASIFLLAPTSPTTSFMIGGAAEGLIAANMALVQAKARPLFCLADPSKLDTIALTAILISEAKREPEGSKDGVGSLLLRGLQRNFPCL